MQPTSGAVLSDFETEALLDSSIHFSSPPAPNPLMPKEVFLTGATGFTGAFLLDELLNRTQATIYCLVRAADSAAALERVVNHLKEFGLWREEFNERIRAIAGDLELPRFGLTEDCFRHLARQIDVIYHSAGSVNMAFTYGRLKATNVHGTTEILRLAGEVSTKPVHFMSSIAIFYNRANSHIDVLKESDTPCYDDTLKGGYSRSKWVADRLVAGAQARGLPASIYRPIRIMGHSQTGMISEHADILPALLKGCILLGEYPDFDIDITLIPVDYLTRAVVHLSQQEKSWGRAFHFFNPAPIPWRSLMSILQSLGYPMQEVSFTHWTDSLKHHASRATEQSAELQKFYAHLRLAMIAPHFLFYKRPPFDASYTLEGLAGSGIVCPPVDKTLISTYIAFWQKRGFLPAPAVQQAAG